MTRAQCLAFLHDAEVQLKPPVYEGKRIDDYQWKMLIELVNAVPEIRKHLEVSK